MRRLQTFFPLPASWWCFGELGCGKSFFVSHMALHIAAGWDWAGKATVAGSVVYITAEGATGFRRRMVAFRQRLRPAPSAEVPFYVIADAPDLGNADGEADDIILAIRQQIDGDVSLIVVDTMSRVMQGADENSARDVSILIANVGKITAALGSSVVRAPCRKRYDAWGAWLKRIACCSRYRDPGRENGSGPLRPGD